MLRVAGRLDGARTGSPHLERGMSFWEWNRRSCRLANALLGLGLAKGDRVAVLAYNCLEWAEIYAATGMAGLVAVPINFRLVGSEVRFIVENAEARALIVQEALRDLVESVRADISADIFILYGSPRVVAGYHDYEDLLARASEAAVEVKVIESDPWTLMYTSGTTRNPKGANRRPGSSAALSLVTDVEMAFTRRDSALLVMPMCHANS